MASNIKGRFVFIPDDGEAAYEIDMDELLNDLPEEATGLWERAKVFFSKKEAAKGPEPTTHSVNLPELVCDKLEELFSPAEWRSRDLEDPPPCYILKIFPRNNGVGWDPMVTITGLGAQTQDITLGDLITDYLPYEPSTEGLH